MVMVPRFSTGWHSPLPTGGAVVSFLSHFSSRRCFEVAAWSAVIAGASRLGVAVATTPTISLDDPAAHSFPGERLGSRPSQSFGADTIGSTGAAAFTAGSITEGAAAPTQALGPSSGRKPSATRPATPPASLGAPRSGSPRAPSPAPTTAPTKPGATTTTTTKPGGDAGPGLPLVIPQAAPVSASAISYDRRAPVATRLGITL